MYLPQATKTSLIGYANLHISKTENYVKKPLFAGITTRTSLHSKLYHNSLLTIKIGLCRIPCVTCSGAGHKDCWNCNGDGVVNNNVTEYRYCDGTAGPQAHSRSATEACSICGGRGRETLVYFQEMLTVLYRHLTPSLLKVSTFSLGIKIHSRT